MKNVINLLLFTILLLNFKMVLGQKQQIINYGVYAGGNVSKFTPMDLSKNFYFGDSYEWSPSYNFGTNINFKFSKSLYVSSGLNFISKKSESLSKTLFSKTFYNTVNGNVIISDLIYSGEYEDKSFALQIPLSLHLIVYQKHNFKSNVHCGFFWENMFKHNVSSVFNSKWNTPNPPEAAIKESEISKKQFNYKFEDDLGFRKSNVGATVGLGISVNKIGFDISLNSPVRVYNSSQYKIPSFCFNMSYQLN